MPLNNNGPRQYFSSSSHSLWEFGLFSFHLSNWSLSVWYDQLKALGNLAFEETILKRCNGYLWICWKVEKGVFLRKWDSECFHWQMLVSWNLCCPFISTTFTAKLPEVYFQMCKHLSHLITEMNVGKVLKSYAKALYGLKSTIDINVIVSLGFTCYNHHFLRTKHVGSSKFCPELEINSWFFIWYKRLISAVSILV